MNSKSVIGQKSLDPHNGITAMLDHLGFVMSAKSTKIVEIHMVKIQDKIKTKVVENVAETIGDDIQTSKFESNEGLRSAMFRIVDLTLTEVVYAGRGQVLDEIQLAHLKESESIVKQLVKSGLSHTNLIAPMAGIVRKLLEKLSEDQHLKEMEGT